MREPHDRDALHAGALEAFQLLVERHELRRCFVGPQDTRGMRIEDDGDRRPAALARFAAHALEQLQMAAVEPVEVAERRNRTGPLRTGRIWEMKDLHRRRVS